MGRTPEGERMSRIPVGVVFLCVPLVGFLFQFFVQWAFHLFLKVTLIKSLLIGFIFGITFVIWVGGTELSPVEVSSNSLLFFGLWYGYFHFVNIGESSLRLRILAEINGKAGGHERVANLYKLYNADEIVRTRIERMKADGQIILKDGRYFLGKRRFILVIHLFEILKSIVMGPDVKGRKRS
jgi:hypothetical protein